MPSQAPAICWVRQTRPRIRLAVPDTTRWATNSPAPRLTVYPGSRMATAERITSRTFRPGSQARSTVARKLTTNAVVRGIHSTAVGPSLPERTTRPNTSRLNAEATRASAHPPPRSGARPRATRT